MRNPPPTGRLPAPVRRIGRRGRAVGWLASTTGPRRVRDSRPTGIPFDRSFQCSCKGRRVRREDQNVHTCGMVHSTTVPTSSDSGVPTRT
jgi:hypothetical protein